MRKSSLSSLLSPSLSPFRTSSLKVLGLATAAALLTACGTLNTLESEVSTYSQWPTDRRPSTYAFERLPSQQAREQEQGSLESQARVALIAAGFREVKDVKEADVTVQVGARVSRYDRAPYDDPFWWRGGGFYGSRYSYARPFWGPGFMYDNPRYDREVAVLIRDRKSNQPLYEARASSDGLSSATGPIISAMFQAALTDFPQAGINPRRVSVQLPSN